MKASDVSQTKSRGLRAGMVEHRFAGAAGASAEAPPAPTAALPNQHPRCLLQ